MPLAHNANSLLYELAPQINGPRARARRRDRRARPHQFRKPPRLRWEADEARVIKEITETFARHEGKPPKGWMGAGAYENPWTPDLLKEAGYIYSMDWPCDDQPIWMRTRSGPILLVPYPVELNDSPQVIPPPAHRREFCDMLGGPVRRDDRAVGEASSRLATFRSTRSCSASRSGCAP